MNEVSSRISLKLACKLNNMTVADRTESLIDRLVRYARIDTQSDPTSSSVPSTEKQKDLGRLLVRELQQLGLQDAELDDKGYVYATLESNTDAMVPVICLCAHMDTSPDCPATDVDPQLHRNYPGGPIHLPQEGILLDPADHPDLENQIGHTVITSDGSTLLGADNKAGVSAIMEAVSYLVDHPEIPHGRVRVLFTPDEEIGRGADHVDMNKLGADFGYTIDGETLGSLEDETFSADMATITFQGVSIHPGFALGKLENAIKIASDFVASLPKDDWSPETTSNREGFVHPVDMKAQAEQATVTLIIRSFVDADLATYAERLRSYAAEAVKAYPGSTFSMEVQEQYRNMKNVLQDHPAVTQYAEEAMERAGIAVVKRSIRGGTDGSRLSFMGLPCPNLFAGEHAFHSREEWVSSYDMQKSTETIVHLLAIWAENGK